MTTYDPKEELAVLTLDPLRTRLVRLALEKPSTLHVEVAKPSYKEAHFRRCSCREDCIRLHPEGRIRVCGIGCNQGCGMGRAILRKVARDQPHQHWKNGSAQH